MNNVLINNEIHKLKLIEAKLSKRFIARKDRRLAPIKERIRVGFASAFQREKFSVLDRFNSLKYRLETKMQESSKTAISFKVKMVERALTPEEIARMINELGNGINMVLYERILQESYADIFKIANAEVELQISTTVGWNVRHRLAEQFIRERADYYIAKYLPNAKQTTIDAIQSQLLQGIEKGEGIPQIKQRLVDLYDRFSGKKVPIGVEPEKGLPKEFVSRAETWARTETSRAYGASTMDSYRGMGVTDKFWISSGSIYAIADVCGENADMGVIGIDEPFYDTKKNKIDCYPAHPNCGCDTGYHVADNWIPNENYEGY